MRNENYRISTAQPLTLAAYDAGAMIAYVEPIAVGAILPTMPVFLHTGHYVHLPLEVTYLKAWETFPNVLKHLLE